MRLICGGCGYNPVEFDNIERPNIQNHPACSVIIVPHPQIVTCPGCGEQLAARVHEVRLSIVCDVVKPNKPAPSLVLVPGRQ